MNAVRWMRVVCLLSLVLVSWETVPHALSARSTSLANPGVLAALSPVQRAALGRQGFVVGPLNARDPNPTQFFDLYRTNLVTGVPSFITTDSALHMFHIMYDKTLVAMERELLAPALGDLSTGVLAAEMQQFETARSAGVRAAAHLDAGFAAVATSILRPGAAIPSALSPQVRAERALIAAHRGPARSPLFGYEIDYSQFAPRGHYNLSPSLRAYFEAMMWFGRVSFLLKGPQSSNLTLDALLLVRPITRSVTLQGLWSEIFDPATAWVGHSDDLTLRDYAPIMTAIFGAGAPLDSLADRAKLATFKTRANQLRGPQINSEFGHVRGMRFFPQRFIVDGNVMQALIWPHAGTLKHPRLWPMGLDVAAALGSSRARALVLGPLHQNTFAHYSTQLGTQSRTLASLPIATWNQNLYWKWLNTLRAVWAPVPEHAPAFMHTNAWQTKNVASGLGSWAELRHDTLLYAKQPYGLGSGGGPPPFRTPYVEPVPQVWARLASLASAFKQTLAAEGLLDRLTQRPEVLGAQAAQSILYPQPARGEQGYRAAIDSFIGLMALLQKASRAELDRRPVAHADALNMENLGTEYGVLDSFFQDNGAGKVMLPQQKIVPVIADVFTQPGTSQVLEEGVGDVLPIRAVVTINGRKWVAEGGAFTYYEFRQPTSNRLTDEAWRAMRTRPPMPLWTTAYITK